MADFDVVLLPSFAQVEAWRKEHADARANGLFAQAVTTFAAWIAELWELHGDGRSIVDSLQRRVIMRAAFDRLGAVGDEEDDDRDALTITAGMVSLAASCVRVAAGVPAFGHAVDQARSGDLPEGCTQREGVLLQGIAWYRELLEMADLVEVGEAAALLAQQSQAVFPQPMAVLMEGVAPLDWQQRHFFESCPQLRLELREAPGADGVAIRDERAGLRFGFPSGRYAQPGLVADLARESVLAGSADAAAADSVPLTVVACKDPLGMYKQLEVPLAESGVECVVQAQVPFESTDFGRRFTSLARVVEGRAWRREDLSDAVLPPFSGFGKAEALEIDKELRANRVAQRDESLARLRVASDMFSQFEELAADPEADILLGVFEQAAFTSPWRSDAWRAEQLGAASALRSCTTAARRVGADMKACRETLEDVKVTASFEGRSAESPRGRVVITTQAAAAQMGAESCNQLILCDLTEQDYPVADKDDAAATLFAKLGLLPTDTALARARRTFAALQQLPTGGLTCLRPLNDWDGNPTYPAVVLQELVDARWPDVAPDDLDETFGLPEQALGGIVQRGEDLLYANAVAAPGATEQPVQETVSDNGPGHVTGANQSLMAVPRRAEGGKPLGFAPSPSQVESYLECPYKWFAQSRVKAEGLDEGFGPMQRGIFSHRVLQEFYRQWKEAGRGKVTRADLAQARQLLRQVADALQEEQYLAEPGSGRYVAASQIELRQLEACKADLASYLDFEADFLPNFHPEYLEYPIELEDGVEYAGRPFIGKVDRIDVDDAGNAVIIDYKGSITAANQIAGKGPDDPGKVQTRMYAQAVQRKLGLKVVGALYVSYGKAHACAGAYDGRKLEAAHLPAMKHDRCSCAVESDTEQGEQDFSLLTFRDMLDRTEQLVARAVDAMEAGEVRPDPSSPDACQYCVAANCPKRGA